MNPVYNYKVTAPSRSNMQVNKNKNLVSVNT